MNKNFTNDYVADYLKNLRTSSDVQSALKGFPAVSSLELRDACHVLALGAMVKGLSAEDPSVAITAAVLAGVALGASMAFACPPEQPAQAEEVAA